MSVYVDRLPDGCDCCVCNDDYWRCNINGESISYDGRREDCPLKVIVHCKDCRWNEECCRNIRTEGRRQDDFCSYGEKVQLSPETSTNGTYIMDGRLMHDLVYRGEAEVETPTNTPTDIISRQAAIDAVETAVFKDVAKSAIESLPPVEPERPKGEWVSNHDGSWNCSECGLRVLVYAKGNCCPNCGADCRGDKE